MPADVWLDAPESALLAGAVDGDTGALGALYDRYSGRVYGFLVRRCGDAELAEDLTGSVFLKAIEALEDNRAWRSSFSGWLFRIARNMLTDHFRAQARHPESALDTRLASRDGQRMEAHAEHEATMERVRAAIADLRPRQAEVLLLRFGEGMSHIEVAETLGMTVAATKVTQHRALKALRAVLGDDAREVFA